MPTPTDHTVVPATCPIGWPAGDRHGHSRTKPTGLQRRALSPARLARSPMCGSMVATQQPGMIVRVNAQCLQEAAGQSAHRLTDLLTRLLGTGETARDTGDAQRGLRLVSETCRNVGDGGDARRMAHNPEVEGSNPSPATKARGPFSNRERAFACGLCTDSRPDARSSRALGRSGLHGGQRAAGGRRSRVGAGCP